MIIDLRDKNAIQNIKINAKNNTFNVDECNVFNERPQLISYEQTTPSDWNTSVHTLAEEGFNTIVQVTADEGNKIAQAEARRNSQNPYKNKQQRQVQFLFWDNQKLI